MKKKLEDLIEKFLAERRKSDGGFADVQESDMALFQRIMNCLITSKFERDPDGDFPVEYKLINRTKFESLQTFLVPYSHIPRRERDNLRTKEEIIADEIRREEANFEATLSNLEIAMSRFATASKIRRLRKS